MRDFQDNKLDELVEQYNTELLAIPNKHAPLILRTSSNPKREPWYDNKGQAAQRDLRRYERAWSKTKSQNNKDKFLFEKDRFKDLLNKTQSEYCTNLIDENKHDQGALFKAINKVMHRAKNNPLLKSDSKKELANDLNEYFNTKIENIRSKCDNNIENPFEYDAQPAGISTFLHVLPLLQMSEKDNIRTKQLNR